jgi:hypothetical protein
MSKIFISQGSLELGRGRNQRRLNAILDNQQTKDDGSDTIPFFQSVDTGEVTDGNSDSHSEAPLFISSPVCIHYSYCKSPHKFMIKCNYPMDCNIKRYYDRYKDNLNVLGIGSLM